MRAAAAVLAVLAVAGGLAGCDRPAGRRAATSDPATVTRIEQQVDGAQQFLDGAEAQLGQDGR